jgi:hypothetical protein
VSALESTFKCREKGRGCISPPLAEWIL